jgi:hypothetical protein
MHDKDRLRSPSNQARKAEAEKTGEIEGFYTTDVAE